MTEEQNDIPEVTETELIQQWKDAKDSLSYWKDKESQLRIAVLERCFKEPPEKGTVHYLLNAGYKLTAVFKESVKIDKTLVDDALVKIENSSPEGKIIAERLFKWTPDLSITEYQLLPQNMLDIVNKVLTFSPGSPSLEFVEPKKKK